MASQKLQQKYRERLRTDPNLRQQYSLLHRLQELTIPTIMIWGKEDRFAPIEDLGYPLRDMLPNLRAFHVFEHSGHQVQNDEVEKFNQVVVDFLLEP
jgi:2-hydroxy-6-oxonona-2,4-dienedioate hydrolase